MARISPDATQNTDKSPFSLQSSAFTVANEEPEGKAAHTNTKGLDVKSPCLRLRIVPEPDPD